ncbi:hypothetical protein A2U01_0099061, partial [Trifolium medium]|nr:hypothetical protein [Trifolium medium]
KEVWIGSFKLRFNQSRFRRKDDERKAEELVRSKAVEYGEGSVHPNRSFRTALVQATGKQRVDEEEDVLQ